MGFNTWNAFGCHVTEGDVRAIARILVRSGLRDKGYRYVNLDRLLAAPQIATRTASCARTPTVSPAA